MVAAVRRAVCYLATVFPDPLFSNIAFGHTCALHVTGICVSKSYVAVGYSHSPNTSVAFA